MKEAIKNIAAKVKPVAKIVGYTAGGLLVAGGAYLAYTALKGAGAEAAAEAVGAVADAAADAAASTAQAALRG